jgi:hypothetical protein
MEAEYKDWDSMLGVSGNMKRLRLWQIDRSTGQRASGGNRWIVLSIVSTHVE